ncbi:MAG: hypothetical protein K6T83_09795 [Alicyclobacillus sp.]|nr:hypothetical protein [Alicyclobacillus sp.]
MKPRRTKPRQKRRMSWRKPRRRDIRLNERKPRNRSIARVRASIPCAALASGSKERSHDIELAKHSASRSNRPHSRQSNRASAAKRKPPALKPSATPSTPKKKAGLGDLLSPKTVQESLKAVGSLRGVVKNCLQYLQHADQMLETFYVTSNTLKESGVLDKLIKQRGKNLTTDDFTNVLIALMNSPLGSQLFRAMGSKGQDTPEGGQNAQASAAGKEGPAVS